MKKLRRKNSDRLTNIVINVLLMILGFVALYPLWFVLIASISDPGAISRGEVILLPKDINFTAYTSMLENSSIWIGYRNSILYLFGGTFIMLLVTLPAAYALSRKELFGRRIFNFIFVFSMYFGGGMIAIYLLHSSIGWLDTPWVLIIPSSMSVYNMILARSNFQEIPESLREAAIIDGSSEFYYFARIVIPLSKAVIAVLFLFTALSWWNEYMRFIIYIDNPDLQSLQVIIRRIFDSLTETSEFSSAGEVTAKLRQAEMLKYSVVVIAALPFCLLYPFVQKYFNKGVMIGAVKG